MVKTKISKQTDYFPLLPSKILSSSTKTNPYLRRCYQVSKGMLRIPTGGLGWPPTPSSKLSPDKARRHAESKRDPPPPIFLVWFSIVYIIHSMDVQFIKKVPINQLLPSSNRSHTNPKPPINTSQREAFETAQSTPTKFQL